MGETPYFFIPNWDLFQHYKDRNPPWIKLHQSVVDNYDHAKLTDEDKWHLASVWIMASKLDNRIPFDPEYLQARLNLHKAPNLGMFLSRGHIELCEDSKHLASTLEADCSGDRRQREERETETEAEIDPSSPQKARPEIDYQGTVDLWNEFATDHNLPLVKQLTEKRRKLIKIKMGTEGFDFMAILDAVDQSPHLLGENDRGWRCDFDFIFERKDKWVKILEGTYSGKAKKKRPTAATGKNLQGHKYGEGTVIKV